MQGWGCLTQAMQLSNPGCTSGRRLLTSAPYLYMYLHSAENPHLPTCVLAVCLQDSALVTSGCALRTTEAEPAAGQTHYRHRWSPRAREVAIFHALCSDTHLRAPGTCLTCTGVGRTDTEPCRTHPGASACSVLGGGAPRRVACGARQLVTFRVLSRRPDEEYGCHLEISAVLQRTLESP